jgi:hypothetical protein
VCDKTDVAAKSDRGIAGGGAIGLSEGEGAGGRAREKSGDAKERGLPGAVRPEQGDIFAGRNVKSQSAKGAHRAVAFFNLLEGKTETVGTGRRSGQR